MTEAKWPELDPAWQRLVEQAREALELLRDDEGIHAYRSDHREVGAVTSLSANMAIGALIDLRDRSPQWARGVEEWTDALHDQLLASDPYAQVAELREELIRDGKQRAKIRRLASEVEEQVGAKPLMKIVPVGAATIAATRARAQLLFRDPGLAPPMSLIATLILQARVLMADDDLAAMRTHPYAVYKIAHALWLSALVIDDRSRLELINKELDRITDAVQGVAERLLAKSRIGAVRDGENVALVFCAGALALNPADPRYVIESLTAATSAQNPRGDWPQGRIMGVHKDPDTGEMLRVSSNEVGLAFIEAVFCLGLVPGLSDRLTPEVTDGLHRAINYLRESRVPLLRRAVDSTADAPAIGWSSTHIYGQSRIEARATAAALRATVAARGVAEQERNVRALETFEDVWDPSDHTPPYLRWSEYKLQNDPDAENPILAYLDEHFVQAALDRKADDSRPWARTQAMSAILFGPPGTTKTTIVKSMAQGLDWPLVTLSPGTFIRDGLENVERRAIEVFSQLQNLERVVVLFDECDELFRARRHSGGDEKGGDEAGNEEVRSISAFMTASMLPKLQDLRDNGQVFFVIATNYFDQIDSAAKRIGRIDRVVGVSWPDKNQRVAIVEERLSREEVSAEVLVSAPVAQAISRLVDRTRYYVRGELVEIANEMAGMAGDLADKEAEFMTLSPQDKKKTIETVVGEVLASKSYSMTDADIANFKQEATKRSACHRADTGELAN